MTEHAPEAQPQRQTEVWHIDFHMSYEPAALAPYYMRAEISRRLPGDPEPTWHMDGIASFDCPPLVPPLKGALLIPYLVYHLDEVKQFLHEEHVKDVFTGRERVICDAIMDQTSACTSDWW